MAIKNSWQLLDDYQILDLEKDLLKFNDNQFDIISVFMVMEHLTNPSNLIQNITRTIRPGGLIIFTSQILFLLYPELGFYLVYCL